MAASTQCQKQCNGDKNDVDSQICARTINSPCADFWGQEPVLGTDWRLRATCAAAEILSLLCVFGAEQQASYSIRNFTSPEVSLFSWAPLLPPPPAKLHPSFLPPCKFDIIFSREPFYAFHIKTSIFPFLPIKNAVGLIQWLQRILYFVIYFPYMHSFFPPQCNLQ